MSGKLWRSTHMNPTRLGASSTFPGSGTNQFTFKLGEAAKNREHQSATHGDMSEFNRAVAGLRADLAEPLTKGAMSSDQALLGFKAAIDAALGRGSQALTEWIAGFK